MNGTLSGIVIALSLLVGAWALVDALRDRAPSRGQLIGLGVVEAALIVLLVAAAIAASGGDRPASAVTFLGYVVTIVCLPPLGWVLARLEPTRWGSVIIVVVCLTVPVLVLRLHQTWQVVTSG
ncbi:hypothetical protein Ais01nite_24650 [Asanoa ishikariensis]|uniref:Uncharacterized protein n=1 Tax=Asanoa ishikariensis TaxID=137265 RepID=A0A1H3R5G0_9ACTN|nr:hypothetical protein Ais01nite_24650 [Asanoa ishikariensis]SDZ20501.1 hypothetical protein SAMN05421684_3454 [Asanoa ishikariensis]